METNFCEIIDLALVTIQDYKIDKLYNESLKAFENYMFGLLKRAIPLFTNCKVDLTYDENGNFKSELSLQEKNILANLLVMIWLEREVNNITQITARIGQGGDAKTYSEAQNLKEKREYLNNIIEKCDHLMNVYSYKNIDISSWASGNFRY